MQKDLTLGIDVQNDDVQPSISPPVSPPAVVVFAQPGGSDRNLRLATLLEQRGFATVSCDLECSLTAPESCADVLTKAVDALRLADSYHGAPIALFGDGIGAVAALVAVALRIDLAVAVVSRSGCPDLAAPWLASVRTPTLFIAGSRDTSTLRSAGEACRALVAGHQLSVISGATERFDEPGAAEEATATVGTWLLRHLRTPPTGPGDAGLRGSRPG